MTSLATSPSTTGAFPAAHSPAEAVAHFRARLAFETDISDVAAALRSGRPGLVVVDTRDEAAWRAGHVPGAVHVPGPDIAARAAAVAAGATLVVTYCWGPGCNGATRGALAFAEAGFAVREMIGGFEYWAREGLEVEMAPGVHIRRAADPLTTVDPVTCGC